MNSRRCLESYAEQTMQYSTNGCCIAGCDKPLYLRGLCEPHYAKAVRRIRKKETTWHSLVSYGLAKAFVDDRHRNHSAPRGKSEIALLYQGSDVSRNIDEHLRRVRERILCNL
jgi:hypothetical protein